MSKVKLPLHLGQILAAELVHFIAPGCDRIAVAGSVRREKAEVGDIEIVCIPKRQMNLFGDPGASLLDVVLADMVTTGRLIRGDKNGEHYKNFLVPGVEGLKLDLFITTPEQWGVIFTIRTGSADFSHRLVTPKSLGGMLPSNLRVAGGRIWDGEKALETPEETDVFKVLGMTWFEPKWRN